MILGTIGLIFFGLVAIGQGCKTLKEIKRIKVNDNDEAIEAKVAQYEYVYFSSDIKPILLYELNGVKRLYKFYTFHRRREYPIGSIHMLNISRLSNVAYDKKDLKKGEIYQYFLICTGLFAIVLLIAYFLKHCN